MMRISVKNISKDFKIGFQKKQSTLTWIHSAFSGKEHKKQMRILDNISFEIDSGEVLGIIGTNGSGKSTLLRIIAGIYSSDLGEITVDGKIISIINLGVGMKERLTMRENVFLVGSLFGMGGKKIKERFHSIVAFSELQEFIDTKIYQFSAGMIQRLAFSIAIHADPEILLLDEVFEVGDESFRKKSSEKIKELVHRGASVIFVTHDLDMIKKQCHRVIWLSDGKIKIQGRTEEVTEKYVKQS
ncbi:MAG: ABC transporter ATP-binding protein [Candidatus Pacebacteria bacterium]|nr:ABC transporter ATP-binding protein [Candidatus Paceibacterota bacterium]MDD5357038.1 ABC transporter ATP-binding protein [Candidatus Paceibacterota bacterium]